MSIRSERVLGGREAAEVLRDLAAGLEVGSLDLFGRVLTVREGVEIAARIKEGGRASLSIKVRLIDAAAGVAGPAARADDASAAVAGTDPTTREGYKPLKKRMRRELRVIERELQAGAWPTGELVEQFVADCHTMTTFPGRGDPLYPEFRRAAGALREAQDRGDEAYGRLAVAEIRRLWKEGHRRFK